MPSNGGVYNMNLDNDQKAAALSEHDRVAVIAAAGSGKTRTLAARFLHLVNDRHIPPSQIALLTFTNKAAHEMRDRIGDSLGLAYCGTFHAFCLRLLQLHGALLGWERDWLTILDEKEAELEERAALKALGFLDARGKWKGCTAGMWQAFTTDMVAGDTMQWDKVDIGPKLHGAWKVLTSTLKAENCLTFGMMAHEAMALLRHPEAGPDIRARWKHVLLDEAQDSDPIQMELVHALEPETVFFVGDPRQSIYSWKGAKPELFMDFYHSEDVAPHSLPNSYRFGINIAAPATRLIDHNDSGLDNAINALGNNEGSITVMHDTPYSEIPAVIRDELAAGTGPQEIAVLARRHATLDAVALELDAAGIPYTRIGGEASVPATAQYRHVRGYLRLAVNPNDRRAFMACAPCEGLSGDFLLDLRKKANKDGVSLLEAYGKPMPKTLAEVLERVSERQDAEPYLPTFGYLDAIVASECVTDTAGLVRMLGVFSMQDELLAHDGESVTLITCHAAKGLEWPVVLLCGMNAKHFPSPRSVKEGREAEERRVAYVSITRSEKRLYLIAGVPEDAGDGPSCYFDEMGAGAPEAREEAEEEELPMEWGQPTKEA